MTIPDNGDTFEVLRRHAERFQRRVERAQIGWTDGRVAFRKDSVIVRLQESVQARIERALGGNYTLEENPRWGSHGQRRELRRPGPLAEQASKPDRTTCISPGRPISGILPVRPFLLRQPVVLRDLPFREPVVLRQPVVFQGLSQHRRTVPGKPAWPERTDRKARSWRCRRKPRTVDGKGRVILSSRVTPSSTARGPRDPTSPCRWTKTCWTSTGTGCWAGSRHGTLSSASSQARPRHDIEVEGPVELR